MVLPSKALVNLDPNSGAIGFILGLSSALVASNDGNGGTDIWSFNFVQPLLTCDPCLKRQKFYDKSVMTKNIYPFWAGWVEVIFRGNKCIFLHQSLRCTFFLNKLNGIYLFRVPWKLWRIFWAFFLIGFCASPTTHNVCAQLRNSFVLVLPKRKNAQFTAIYFFDFSIIHTQRKSLNFTEKESEDCE